MKTLKTIFALLFCIALLSGTSSCVVYSRHDNGNHKGWYKNQQNPHHPYSANPGNSNGKSRK
ncbi:MAG: hypothetical protein A2X05_08435 [Bacteroidetes bacterium GWE2_41_25]|nr:MAG: hypothetical protein A2X03_06825 [Bacteroidetes bacterium GWA2_40_15]OFX91259.1 MAG: hypothetical protein A2X06_01470 [Bacteroidetes bacterium GWC2_40_22]OFX92950.1 MAG: hypothetical protein A2X05_08435 [Bacteroidetes bacterium GWE2_41_25]OFY57638.1 MAG: hypothetical protein A2X04_16900 [Bacteroidetes bacterium GWF2_41_9]HAM08916.1 hypothetical protein [Bacteroidales bacterium]